MKYNCKSRACVNQKHCTHLFRAAINRRLWLLTFSFTFLLAVASCGSDDDKQAKESSTGTQGQGGSGSLVTTGAAGSEKASSVDANLSNNAAGKRANAGGASGASGTSGAAGVAGSAGAKARKPKCLTTGSQVVLLGDSYVNWITHTFPDDINNAVGQPVRNYAIGGYSMASGGIGMIPPELDQAVADDPDIIAVVMDGGGNDILIPDILQFPQGGECKNDPTSASIPDCQAIINLAIDTAVQCMDALVEANIPDVIYFFYPHVPSTWLATSPNGILDYALPLAKEACDNANKRTNGKLNCHFVDLNPVFAGHPEYFAESDLHENSEGSAAMAKAIWKVMVDNCIAQPESSGCCDP